MPKFAMLAIACLLAFGACSEKVTWKDTTGQGRSADLATTDYNICYANAGFPAENATSIDQAAAAAAPAKLQACMREQGWEQVTSN